MVDDAKTDPNTSCSIKQIIEEGDKVVAYSYITKKNMKIAVFHMFRFANGKIVEMWDIGQEILNDSPNENGLF
jgi:predicted SnoaL-like aldol condensation-catalyzing enzyme